MSLLIPVLGRLRRMAVRTIDLSNLRQFVVACASYASDNDATLPVSTREGVVTCGYCDDMAWFRHGSYTNLQQYVKDPAKKIFTCISAHDNTNYLAAMGRPRDCSGVYHDTLPPSAVNGTHIGWNYYAGRVVNNCNGGLQPAYDPAGNLITNDFQFPLRTGGKATSRTLVTCPNWVSGSGAWNGRLLHLDPDDETRPAPIGYPLWGVPDFPGMNVGYIDGGAAWVKTENMGVFKDVNWMYFDRFR
jgi:hypothetical protein